MPRNNSNKLVVARRRRAVAAMRLRHLTQVEITQGLAQQGITNPRTGEPYDLATVNRDLKALEAEWREAAADDIARLKGNHLAALREVQRVAWRGRYGQPQLTLVLRALDQEAKVLGLVSTDSARSREEQLVHQATEDFRLGAEAAREVYRRMQAKGLTQHTNEHGRHDEPNPREH